MPGQDDRGRPKAGEGLLELPGHEALLLDEENPLVALFEEVPQQERSQRIAELLLAVLEGKAAGRGKAKVAQLQNVEGF